MSKTKNIRVGKPVQFSYNAKERYGTVESIWFADIGKNLGQAVGFCIDHGGYYKSYRLKGVSNLVMEG